MYDIYLIGLHLIAPHLDCARNNFILEMLKDILYLSHPAQPLLIQFIFSLFLKFIGPKYLIMLGGVLYC
jgi:hypothetical protein